ncbi:MAG: hypothetical protein IPP12_22430 [Nitrospira sp.]|nr:hypothetical protein [Nitrospira sp.]
MIRSIAYELFNRLTTDPDMLREKLAESERIRYKLADDLLNHTMGPVAFARNQQKADLEAERDALQLQVRELQGTTCKVTITSDTIEPTWILALWSIHAEGWTESKRGSYDAMIAEMHRSATAWNLFPRSQWDALVNNGRAR